MKAGKITLFVMTQKGFDVVNTIVNELGPSVISKVISAQDVNIMNDFYEEIWGLCKANQLPFYDKKELPQVDTQYALAVSWRWLLDINPARLIVLHDSLLPRYRGFAPLVNALINGEKETGVTAIFSTDEYDRGDILKQARINLQYPIKIRDAINEISVLYSGIATAIIKQISEERALEAVPQDGSKATYSLWLNDDDYFIDWSLDAATIKRFIDAVGHPYKAARTWDGERYYIIAEAVEEEDVIIENRHIGKVLFIRNNEPVVVCGSGLLRIKEITDENGNNLLPLKKFRIRFRKP